MPPEQFGGRTVPASDLYSLGATLICVLTGTHPADLPQLDGCIQFIQQVNISRSFALWLERTIQPSLERRFTSASQALQILKNPPPLLENRLVVTKPRGSKVVLHKDTDSLEIVIPPAGFTLEMLALLGFAIAWNSFIFFWTGAVIFAPFPINVPFVLFSLPFWIAGIGMVRDIIWGLFRQTQLRIDRQQMCLTHKIFGFKYNSIRPAPREDITKLEYTKKSFEFDFLPDLKVRGFLRLTY